MWNLVSRDIIVLASVISVWAVVCNIFGPWLALVLTFVLILCCWLIRVLATDTPSTRHVYPGFQHIERAIFQCNRFLEDFYQEFFIRLTNIARPIIDFYQTRVQPRMAQRSTYQLSSETHLDSETPKFNLIKDLSPIPRRNFRDIGNASNIENKPFPGTEIRQRISRSNSLGQLTSTPLVSWRKDAARNGGTFSTNQGNLWKNSHSLLLNHSSTRQEDTSYSPEGIPWGTSISPKMRPRAGGIKTVQTIAGPLLASTRYNIDPKIYSDVTSPGLTTRLTKYATEANTKLTHQAQYGTGQFPKVNLYTSPTPLMSSKSGKTRMSVTVRIAPPENIRHGPGDKQQSQSEIRQDNKPGLGESRTLCKAPLKRHVSRDDVTMELVKKQRTDRIYNDELENLEEMTQKRARDDSSRSEEETSLQNVSLRPAKRTKVPSCHDILSSLSSSINVSSRLKRKALDVSRSGTPDAGKHFKSLDSSENEIYLTRSVSEPTKPNKQMLNVSEKSLTDSESLKVEGNVADRNLEMHGKAKVNEIRDSENINERASKSPEDRIKEIISRRNSQALKLRDKLFMKAEPENIDKIKTLIEEHESIKPRFTTDRTEEIKKADIVNMRQTSMKNRLKSMFDAISGKATSKIDPEVVIQAEDKSWSPSQTPASLSSLTSTTNVNTSPISTSAIVPIIGKTKTATSPTKHVTFQFGDTQTANLSAGQPAVKVEEAKKQDITTPKLATNTTGLSFMTEVNKSPPTSNVPAGASQLESKPVSSSTSVFSLSAPNPHISKTEKTISGSESSLTAPSTTSVLAITTSGLSPRSANSSSSQLFVDSSQATEKKGFTFGKTTKNPTSETPSLAANSTTGSGFSFVKNSTPTTSFATSTAAPTSSTFSSTTGSPFNFGNKSTSENTKSGFNFTPKTTNSAFPNDISFPGQIHQTNPSNTEQKSLSMTSQSSIFGTTSTTPLVSAPATTSSSTSANIFGATTSATTPPSLFGTTTTTSSGGTQPGVFGATSTSGTGPTVFGTTPNSSTSQPSNFGLINSPAMTSSQNMFGTPTTLSGTTQSGIFGTTNSSVTTQPSVFGTTSTATTAQSIFGTTTSSTTTAPNVFGTPSNSSGTTPLPSIFGTTSSAAQQPNMFGTITSSGPTQPSMFGTTTSSGTVQPSMFGTTTASSGTTQPSIFGTTTSETTQPSMFGTTTSLATAQNVFGTTTSSGTTTQSSMFGTTTTATTQPMFGTNSSGTTSQPNTFGTTTTTSQSNMFGVPSTSTTGFGTTPSFPATSSASIGFGTPKSENSVFGSGTSASSSLFNASNQNPTSFGNNFRFPSAPFAATTTPSFTPGSNNASSLFSSQTTESTTTSGFSGLSNIVTQTFGTPRTAPGPTNTFTTSSAVFSPSTTSAFGTTNSSFGATTTAPSAFSSTSFGVPSSTSGFGTNSTPAFSNTSNVMSSGFGNNGATPFATPSANTEFQRFGSSGTNEAQNQSFSFNSQPSAQPPSQNSLFTFGANSNAPGNGATNSTPVFQFNATAPQTGGFNFSGAPTTPSMNFTKDGTSNASYNMGTGGNMFSIGTGSTVSRSRASRRRQR